MEIMFNAALATFGVLLACLLVFLTLMLVALIATWIIDAAAWCSVHLWRRNK